LPLTVRGLVSLPQLGLMVKAGAAGLDREIRWAHAIELDDPAPWLTGGELILTTGWRKSADDPSWTDYIERLDDAGAAALGFGVGLAHSAPPPALTTSAERRRFPLISVPLPVPFIAVIRAVTDGLAEDRMAEIRSTIDHLSRIIRTAAEKGVTGVVADLARFVGGAVVVTDANLNVRAAEPPDPTALIERMTEELGRRPQRWRGKVGASVSDAAGQLTVQSVVPTTGAPGYIAVATATPLHPMQRLLVSQAATLIALEWQEPRLVREHDDDIRTSLLELALNGALAWNQLERHVRHFGFAEAEAVVALSITSSLPVTATMALTRATLTQLNCPYLASSGPDEVLVLTTAGKWRQAADELLTRLKASRAVAVSIGIGKREAWQELSRTVQQARHARYAGQAGHREQVEFQKMGAFGILLATHSHATLNELADSVLAPLDNYDRTGGELVATVKVFLQHNGHWESAAASLGIHRHSLRYRIRKVEQLTGRSMESSADRSEFLIAITAREFVRNAVTIDATPP
jgi:purine catabolism regulator